MSRCRAALLPASAALRNEENERDCSDLLTALFNAGIVNPAAVLAVGRARKRPAAHPPAKDQPFSPGRQASKTATGPGAAQHMHRLITDTELPEKLAT